MAATPASHVAGTVPGDTPAANLHAAAAVAATGTITAAAPATARTPRVSANLRLFLALAGVLLALFALLRLSLVLQIRGDGDATWGELARAFLLGARFDFSAVCLLLAPVMVFCYVPWTSPWRGPRTRRAFVLALTVLVAVAGFLLVSEVEFFREFQTRYNQLAIRYLDHPEIVLPMIWYNYPVVRYLLAGAAGAAVIYLCLRAVVRWAGRAAAVPPPFGTPAWRRAAVFEVAGGAVVVLAVLFGARGGFQSEPLRWGDAFKGDNEFVSQMSLNGLWCLFQAVRETASRGGEAKGWTDHLSHAEARDVVRGSLLAPGETAADPAGRTLLRKGDGGSSVLLRTASGKPANVVVVMMESFSARFSGSTGAPRSFTPAFDALAKDGVLFDRCFSAGSHTHQGIFATQLGFPNLPGYETLMESGAGNQEFMSLPAVFQARGYRTFFLYNGNFAWDNMRGFFRKQGVDTFVGGDEMLVDAKFKDHVWGVSDGDLFDRCNQEFEAAAKAGPFYAAVMTLSNHAPFEVPKVPGAEPITDMGDLNRRLTAMRYADYSVGQFIEGARKLSYFKDTLFVFVGDHGFAVKPVLTDVNLLYHHVPLLFYAPGLVASGAGANATRQAATAPVGEGDRTATNAPSTTAPATIAPTTAVAARVDHRVASHMNVVPSVVGLLGMSDAQHAAWGRSLFADGFADPNFAVFKMSGGGSAVALAQGDDLLVIKDAKADPQLLRYTLWPPAVTPEAGPDAGPRKQAMARVLRAYVQAALTDLTGHKAGPVDEPGKGAAVGAARK
jgi:phosphoglycerol transferase MdoB-like AlkP superfamily enzyme